MPRLVLLLCCVAAVACEDPARPIPDASDGVLFVDSDPRGGRISIDGVDRGEITPALIDDLEPAAYLVSVALDTADFIYTFEELVVVTADSLEASVARPLTIRCTNRDCLLEPAQFHSPGNVRFVVNAAGPLFLYNSVDAGITWPISTQNSYSPIGTATVAGLIAEDIVALGLGNVGNGSNHWAGRPLPVTTAGDPYRVSVPAWITPPVSTSFPSALRGVEVIHEVIVDESLPDVLHVRVTWTNVSADSVYRLLDPLGPAEGVTISQAWLGFMLDADVGRINEADDDLVSYDVERNMVFAYDGDFSVSGFSGGWSSRPGLIGLMMPDAAPGSVRLNAWPRERDFVAGSRDEDGYFLLRALQFEPANHPDDRIGYAPDTEDDDYIISVTTGPFTLAPGESETLTFAILLAAPAPGTFASGVLFPAGDPLDGGRPLAATAANLRALADSVISSPDLP